MLLGLNSNVNFLLILRDSMDENGDLIDFINQT